MGASEPSVMKPEKVIEYNDIWRDKPTPRAGVTQTVGDPCSTLHAG